MKKEYFKLGLLAILLNFTYVKSQTSTLTNNIVDFSTIKESDGTANISIPFHQLSIKGYTLPVSLNYNSEGVKVDNESSNIGQNWELSTTGVITRTAKGYFDESSEQMTAIGRVKRFPVGENPYGGSYIECIGIRAIQAKGYLYNLNLAKQIYNDYKNFVPPVGIQTAYNDLAKIKNYLTTTTTTIGQNVIDIVQDVHPDVFTVIIPNKEAFTFLFNQDGNIVSDSKENFKIIYDKKGKDLIQEFVLIDEDGIKYTFSNLETFNSDIYDNNVATTAFSNSSRGPVTNTTLDYNLDQNGININTPFCVDDSNYPATPDLISKWQTPKSVAWYLSKIENRYGETIQFTYEATRSISIPRAGFNYKFKQNNSYPSDPQAYISGSTKILLSEVPIIKNIASDTERLVFDYRRFRQDVLSSGDKNRLKELNTIYLYQNVQNSNFSLPAAKRMIFNQRYVVSDDFYTASANSDKAVYKRLFLDQVDVLGKESELLSYFKFTYKEPQKLPYKQSFNIDLWGYFKGGDNVAIFPNLYYYGSGMNNFDKNSFSVYPRLAVSDNGVQISSTPSTYTFTPFYKDATPNFSDASSGILTNIESFGGSTSYVYESNYYDYYGISRPGPGLRIKKILRNDGSNEYTKEFSYGLNNNGRGYISAPTKYGYLQAPAIPGMWWSQLDHYVTSLRSGGEKVNYDVIKIEEKKDQNNNGFIVNRYSLFNPYYNPNITIGSFSYVSPTLTSYLIRSQGLSGPYYYDTQNYYDIYENRLDKINGQLLNQKVYDSNNNLLKELTNDYTLKFNEVPDYKAYITGGYYFSNYLFRYLLSKETLGEKFGNNLISTETNYLRNTEDKVNEVIVSGASNNSRTIIKFQYEENTTIGTALKAQNRLNDVSVVRNYNNNELVQTTKRIYNTFTVPIKIISPSGVTFYNKDVLDFQYEDKSLDGTSFIHNSEITKYGLYGNVTESKINNIFNSTVFGYNGSLPIAMVKGASNSQIATASQNIISASDNRSSSYSESSLQAQLDAFRTNNTLMDSSVETFVHDPLIGKKISTSSNGIREYVQYDGANRVKRILDKDQNIVKEFNYNYIGAQRFYNTKKEQTFTRNNCRRLENAGSYNYVVPAGVFSSSISQAEAEQKAIEEIGLMGQYTANIYSSCDPKPFDCTISTDLSVSHNGGSIFNQIYNSTTNKFTGQIAFNSKTYNWSTLGFEVKVGKITGICQPIITKSYSYTTKWNLRLLPNGDLYASWRSPFGNVTANSLIIIPFEFTFDNL